METAEQKPIITVTPVTKENGETSLTVAIEGSVEDRLTALSHALVEVLTLMTNNEVLAPEDALSPIERLAVQKQEFHEFVNDTAKRLAVRSAKNLIKEFKTGNPDGPKDFLTGLLMAAQPFNKDA